MTVDAIERISALQDPIFDGPLAGGFGALASAAIAKAASDLSDPNPVDAEHVINQMRANYPDKALAWMRDARWIGPVQIPQDRIDDDDMESWAATKDKARVKHFARRIADGDHIHPVVAVQEPGENRIKVIDGHHRTLAYRKAGEPVTAYVGFVDSDGGPWDETHVFQVHQGDSPANKGFDPAEPRDEHGKWTAIGEIIHDLTEGDIKAFDRRLQKAKSGGKAEKLAVSTDAFAPKQVALGSYEITGDSIDGFPDAVGQYQTHGEVINMMLRLGEEDRLRVEGDGWYGAHQLAYGPLKAAMRAPKAKLKDDIVVERGIRNPGKIFGDAWQQDGSNVGLTWEDAGFVSTTTVPTAADAFATREQQASAPTVMRILVPRGTPAIKFGAKGTQPNYNWEHEILLNKGLRFRVVNDHGVDATGIRRIDVEVISSA